MLNLVLASQSPRRSELLRRHGFEFTVSSTQISEIPDENLNLTDQIRDLALRKARACLEMGKAAKGKGNLVLAADTVVVLDDQILGKPDDRPENRRHLERLSGRTHSVITAVCLLDVDRDDVALGHAISEIEFRVLSSADIDEYVASGEGFDKAGGYGIQGAAGKFVAELRGDKENVVGLPVFVVEQLLREKNWAVRRAMAKGSGS